MADDELKEFLFNDAWKSNHCFWKGHNEAVPAMSTVYRDAERKRRKIVITFRKKLLLIIFIERSPVYI
jgi:hypothetical protein